MKILMIAPEPFFTPRGTPFSVRGRIHALVALGHSVDLVTYHAGEDVSLAGLRIFRTPQIPWLRNIPIGPSFTKIYLDVLLFGLAVMKLRSRQYDVIHTHEEAGLIGALFARWAKAKHLYDMHSSLPQQFKNFASYNYAPIITVFEMIERFVVRRADAVIAICPELLERVATIDKERPCFLIENTI
ncbi:MAG TPA: glycosyltransferase [Candidatus Binatia bacterium]|jgi:glycosyltransferase involved in cell wall biosynthesis